jgi:4-hydroxy-tetrahydrodipicolinate reductase
MAPVRIAVKGAAGRMGRRIAVLAGETPGAAVAAAVERADAPCVGQSYADLEPTVPGVTVTADVGAALAASDVLIDFTVVHSTLADLDAYAAAGKPVVIGTTGFTNAERDQIRAKLAQLPYVLAPNMSIGVNVLFNLVRQAAKALGQDYDVEITEAHHKMKKDAPSGTAVGLAEAAAEALGRAYPGDAVFRQRGLIGERTPREIGMQVIRGGDVVGDHTVFFLGMGERVELTHRAHTRDTFARGAIRAALWVAGKPVGAYDMQDVLGLRTP